MESCSLDMLLLSLLPIPPPATNQAPALPDPTADTPKEPEQGKIMQIPSAAVSELCCTGASRRESRQAQSWRGGTRAPAAQCRAVADVLRGRAAPATPHTALPLLPAGGCRPARLWKQHL